VVVTVPGPSGEPQRSHVTRKIKEDEARVIRQIFEMARDGSSWQWIDMEAADRAVLSTLAGYLEEVASVRKTLDSRYDDLRSGRVKPIDGEEAFRTLREKSERRRSDG